MSDRERANRVLRDADCECAGACKCGCAMANWIKDDARFTTVHHRTSLGGVLEIRCNVRDLPALFTPTLTEEERRHVEQIRENNIPTDLQFLTISFLLGIIARLGRE